MMLDVYGEMKRNVPPGYYVVPAESMRQQFYPAQPYYVQPQPVIPQPIRAQQQYPVMKKEQRDTAPGSRSAVLEEFRNSKTRKYELRDILGHVVEFSGDQHGSRFIQQKLETSSSEDKQLVFDEMLPNALQLMTDVFGNYVVQKFFEHGIFSLWYIFKT